MHSKFAKIAFGAAAIMSVSTASAQVNLTAETGGVGQIVHLGISSLVEYSSEAGVANIQLKDGQTATNYTQTVGEGKVDFASGPFILPFLLSLGAGPYANVGKEKGAELAANIRVLYPYTLGVFFLYGYDSKGVDGWDDLKGRKILNGPPRGAATTNSRNLIRVMTGLKHDEDYESVTVSWNQAAASVVDGTVDIALIPELFPSGRITQVGAAGAMTAYSMPMTEFESEAGQNILNKPGSTAFRLSVKDVQTGLGEGWSVVSEDGTFRGMAVVGGDMVNKSMDEELAYKLTKMHIDNLDNIKAKAPFAAYANYGVLDAKVSGMCGPNPLKYHRGAVRAWEEAGYTVPACAKP
jgi:TRAP-type uncharacterized transport system substrate-binding protein